MVSILAELIAEGIAKDIAENGVGGYFPAIDKVIYSNPATIILWSDGVKTVVKCLDEDEYDKEKGFAMALLKRLLGNKGTYNELFKKFDAYED